ncbi:MAG: cell division protein FtsQ/DivIB [Actinomycetota bacterium]
MRAAEGSTPASHRWTTAGLVVVLVATGAIAATYSPLFAAGDIRLRGATGIPRQDVLSLARIDDRSNVFHLDTRGAERRLERDPRILTARVTTSLPDGIEIEIVPRVAVAVLGREGELVGDDGVVIGPAGPDVDLPALVTADGHPPVDDALASAAATAGALDGRLRGDVEAVVIAPDGRIRVRLTAGFPVTFGSASELSAKAESLAALLAWIEEEEVAVFSADLTVPGSPTAKLDRGSGSVPVS